MILQATWQKLAQKYQGQTEQLKIADMRFGPYLCAVKLSNGTFGISSVIEDSQIHCDKKHRDFGEFTPLQIVGKTIGELFETEKNTATVIMLRLACMNALSSAELNSKRYDVLPDTDPFDLLSIDTSSKVIIVGAFHTYIEKCVKLGCDLGVLELDQEALNPDHRHLYIPAADYHKVIPGTDILIVTGLTLVNDTLEDILQVVEEKTQVVVTGPSSSLLPDVLFENKVDIIGGVRITDPERLLDLVGQGAAGYHLFRYCAEKISIRNADSRLQTDTNN